MQGLLTFTWVATLPPEKAFGKARGAGLGDSKAKTRNAAGRLFGRNPEGRDSFCAALCCSSLMYIKYITLLAPCAAQKLPPSQRSK